MTNGEFRERSQGKQEAEVSLIVDFLARVDGAVSAKNFGDYTKITEAESTILKVFSELTVATNSFCCNQPQLQGMELVETDPTLYHMQWTFGMHLVTEFGITPRFIQVDKITFTKTIKKPE